MEPYKKRGIRMKHKIVFFDMDGTLYQTENDVIQDSTIAAIQNLKEAGYIVAAATGRPLNQMKLILQRLDFDYYVLINGGYILDHDFNMISASPIKHDTLESLVKLAQDQEYGLMLHLEMPHIYTTIFIQCMISANTAMYLIHCSMIRLNRSINATTRTMRSF